MVNCINVTEIIVLAVTTFLYVITVFINYWSSSDNASALGLQPVGDVSDKYSLVVTPAGWTFAIWGVIYVWQFLWLLYGWRFVLRPSSARIIPLLTYVLFSVSCLLNIGWIYAFTNEQLALSFVLLFFIALSLYATIGVSVVVFYYRVEHLKRQEQKVDLVLTTILLHNGLAVYATWTSIATLLNLGFIMQYTGDHRVDETTVGIVILSILLVEEIAWFLLENSVLDRFVRYIFTIYPVLIWALSGVLSNHLGEDDLEKTNSIAVGALVLSGLLFIVRVILSFINCAFRRLEYPNVEYRSF